MQVPPDARVVVVVVGMAGCPACEDYTPRVEALAPSYARVVPVVYLDAASHDPKVQKWMDEHGIGSTPTTIVMRRQDHLGGGEWRMVGSVDDASIRQMFDFAYSRLFAR